jgi:hypothetical protein
MVMECNVIQLSRKWGYSQAIGYLDEAAEKENLCGVTHLLVTMGWDEAAMQRNNSISLTICWSLTGISGGTEVVQSHKLLVMGGKG